MQKSKTTLQNLIHSNPVPGALSYFISELGNKIPAVLSLTQ